MRIGTTPSSLFQSWQFGVEINGFNAALFSKGKEPSIEFEEVAFAPAGSMYDQKTPGRVKFEDITLEKGVLQNGADQAALTWLASQVDVLAGTGGVPSDCLRDVDLVRFDRSGRETRRWTLHGAWIKKYEGDELEGGKTDNSIEKITLCYQYWTVR